jgi:hypothetical protein
VTVCEGGRWQLGRSASGIWGCCRLERSSRIALRFIQATGYGLFPHISSRPILPATVYVTSSTAGSTTDLATNPFCTTYDFRAVPQEYRSLVPEFINDYVSLNQFAA